MGVSKHAISVTGRDSGMTTVRNPARERLEAGELALGVGLRQARTVDIGPIMKACGFDYLFIDLEHNTMNLDMAAQISVAAHLAGIAPIVRVPGFDRHLATRVLDGGAMGVVVPHVDTPEQAKAAVDHCKFPPIGHRSMTGTLPHLDFENPGGAELPKIMNENIMVVVMLETPTAIENADAIAAVEGIDVLLIGTNDLSAEMGIPGDFGNDRVVAAYETTIAAARKHGIYAGMGGVYDMEIASRYIGMGAQFLLGGNDTSFILAGGKQRTQTLRSIER